MVIKMLPGLGRRLNKLSENLYKEIKNIKMKHSEIKNTINEMKKHYRESTAA